MFDLENVVDNQTAAEELEEVVMGLYHQFWSGAQPGIWRAQKSERRRF